MATHTPESTQSQSERAQEFMRSAPERSLTQRMDALGEANRIRTSRANLKRDLKAGRKSVLDILLSPPEYAMTMKLYDLMLATPKYGRVKVNKILQQIRISPSKTIGGLSQRQRSEIVSMMGRHQESESQQA